MPRWPTTIACMSALGLTLLPSTQGLAASILYSCTFPKVASPDGLSSAKNFTLKFAYDDFTKEAVMIGNNGVAKAHPIIGGDGITFLETLTSGAVQSTTISSKGQAVHSRNTIMFGDVIPSQYYGTCTSERNQP